MPVVLLICILGVASVAGAQALPAPERHDFIVRNFRFQSGESLPEVKIHYRTAGTALRDGNGRITNGVLVLHGSSGDAGQVLAASFSDPLFGKAAPLDAARHFLIFPDNLGNGRSTKPSDGLRATFPKYGYHDMVTLQHQLVTEGLGIQRLRLIIGISMGGVQRPARLGESITSYAAADAHLKDVEEETLEEDDANNILYRFESSFDFNPEPELEQIRARVLTILFEDDELNPTTLGTMERLMPKVKGGRMVVIPAGRDTEGHRTQVKASVWRHHLQAFMETLSQ